MKRLIGCRLLFNLRVTLRTHTAVRTHRAEANTHAHVLKRLFCRLLKVSREIECGFCNSVLRSKVNRFVTISKDLSVGAKMPKQLLHTHTHTHLFGCLFCRLCASSHSLKCVCLDGGHFVGQTSLGWIRCIPQDFRVGSAGLGLANHLHVPSPNWTSQSECWPSQPCAGHTAGPFILLPIGGHVCVS